MFVVAAAMGLLAVVLPTGPPPKVEILSYILIFFKSYSYLEIEAFILLSRRVLIQI
jgi:hypothetical protein